MTWLFHVMMEESYYHTKDYVVFRVCWTPNTSFASCQNAQQRMLQKQQSRLQLQASLEICNELFCFMLSLDINKKKDPMQTHQRNWEKNNDLRSRLYGIIFLFMFTSIWHVLTIKISKLSECCLSYFYLMLLVHGRGHWHRELLRPLKAHPKGKRPERLKKKGKEGEMDPIAPQQKLLHWSPCHIAQRALLLFQDWYIYWRRIEKYSEHL